MKLNDKEQKALFKEISTRIMEHTELLDAAEENHDERMQDYLEGAIDALEVTKAGIEKRLSADIQKEEDQP